MSVALPRRVRRAAGVGRRGAPAAAFLPAERAALSDSEQPEEQRREEDRDHRRRQDAADHAGADRAQAVRARRRSRSRAARSRGRTRARSSRSRAAAAPAASIAASRADMPCAHALDRELADQDRVLRRQADQRDEADLEVHVVLEAAHPGEQQRAEDRRSAPSAPPRSAASTSRTARRAAGTRRSGRRRTRSPTCCPTPSPAAPGPAHAYEKSPGSVSRATASIAASAWPEL